MGQVPEVDAEGSREGRMNRRQKKKLFNRKCGYRIVKLPRNFQTWAFQYYMGTEGEKSRSEGGESYTFEDAPKQIYDTLNRYRLARVGGKTYEAEKKQT